MWLTPLVDLIFVQLLFPNENLANKYLGNIGFIENDLDFFLSVEAIIGKNTSFP